jgi:hypothetical protein
MSQLGSLLRQITKKSSHPNTLIYEIQLERARQKLFVQRQLDDGKDDAVALEAPRGDVQEQTRECEKTALGLDNGNGIKAAVQDGEAGKEEDAKSRPNQEDGGNAVSGGPNREHKDDQGL